MSRLAALYSGSSMHHRALTEPKYWRYLSELIYLPELHRQDLDHLDGLIITCRLHEGLLLGARDRLLSFLEAGRTVIQFGEQPEPVLPGARWEQRETNFWWWLDPDDTSGLEARLPEHSLFSYMSLESVAWHYHGIFRPPLGAEEVILAEDGGCVLYVDRVSTPGTMIITSLDPFYHFGSYFMPAAERFLDGFFRWLTEDLLRAEVGG